MLTLTGVCAAPRRVRFLGKATCYICPGSICADRRILRFLGNALSDLASAPAGHADRHMLTLLGNDAIFPGTMIGASVAMLTETF